MRSLLNNLIIRVFLNFNLDIATNQEGKLWFKSLLLCLKMNFCRLPLEAEWLGIYIQFVFCLYLFSEHSDIQIKPSREHL